MRLVLTFEYNINFQINHVFTWSLENSLEVIKISDIYKFNERMEETIKVEYGNWNSVDGLTVYEPNIWKRRSNFQGYKFR